MIKKKSITAENRLIWQRFETPHQKEESEQQTESTERALHKLKDKIEGREFALMKKDGSTLLNFFAEKKKNSNLSEEEYLNFLKNAVSTKDQWHEFEEKNGALLQDASKFPKSLTQKIRDVGREIFGIKQLIKSIESQYSIRILTDAHELPAHIRAKYYPVISLEKFLQNLRGWLGSYPKSFLQNSGLQTVHMATDWESDDSDIDDLGGFYFGEGKIAITGDSPRTFHHELLHCADASDGGLENDNIEWGVQKHGSGFAKLYPTESEELKKLYWPRPEGFVRAYGKYGGIDEDQATVADAMWTNYHQVMLWAEREPALSVAVNEIKAFYYALSGGKMDEIFWKEHADGAIKIDRNYWDKRSRRGRFQEVPAWESRRNAFAKSREILALMESKKLEEASQKLVTLLKDHPSFISYSKGPFEVLLFLVDSKERVELYEALAQNSDHPLYYLEQLVSLYRTQNDREKLRSVYERLVENGTENPNYFEELGNIYREEQKYQRALVHYVLAQARRSLYQKRLSTRIDEMKAKITNEQMQSVHTEVLTFAEQVSARLDEHEYPSEDIDFLRHCYAYTGQRKGIIPILKKKAILFSNKSKEQLENLLFKEDIPWVFTERDKILADLLHEQVLAGDTDAQDTYIKLHEQYQPVALWERLPAFGNTYLPQLATLYTRTIEEIDSPLPKHYDSLGSYMLLGKRYEDAFRWYEKSLQVGTKNTSVLKNLGVIEKYIPADRLKLFVQYLINLMTDRSIKMRESNYKDMNELSFVCRSYLFCKQAEKAISTYVEGVNYYKNLYTDEMTKHKKVEQGTAFNYFFSYADLAKMYHEVGKTSDAIMAYRDIISIFNNDPHVGSYVDTIRMELADIEKEN